MWQLLYGYPRFPAADDVINEGLIASGLAEDICASYALICCRAAGFTSNDLSKLFISTLLLRYAPCDTNRCISESSADADGTWRNCIGVWRSLLSSVINWERSSADCERPNLTNDPLSVPIASSLRGLNSSEEIEKNIWWFESMFMGTARQHWELVFLHKWI